MEEDIDYLKRHIKAIGKTRSTEAIENLINKNKELEKMIELMAKELAICGGFDYVEFGMSTGDFNKDIKNMIDYFKKKAKGE